MKFLNVIFAYAIYFVGNVILYRRDWSELRERRKVTFAGSGKVGSKKSVTDKFDKEPAGYIEPKKYAVLKREPIKPELIPITDFKQDEPTKKILPPVIKGSSRF